MDHTNLLENDAKACGQQWLRSNENPMVNRLIAERLFEINEFSCSDYKNIRLVCNLWTDLTFERWRQQAWLVVKDKDKLPCISPSSYMQMLKMKGDPFQLTGEFGFRNYKVIMTNLSRGSNLEFWEQVGPFMEKLDIVESSGASAIWRQVLFHLTPNVRELSLRNNYYGWDFFLDRSLRWDERLRPTAQEIRNNLTKLELVMRFNASRFPVSWIFILTRFPNIESLKIQGTTVPPRRSYWTPNTADGQVIPFFDALQVIRQQMIRLPPLRHLDILNLQLKALNQLPPNVASTLERFVLPIASLALDVGYQNEESGPFSNILHLYSRSLERLVAFRAPYSAPFPQDFPFGTDLPMLTELQLIGPICKNLDFLTRTPKLKILVLWNGNNQMKEPPDHSYLDYSLPHITQKRVKGKKFLKTDSVISSTNFNGEAFKDLELPCMEQFVVGSEECSVEEINALSKMMQNLSKVRLGLNNDSFARVCETWGDKIQHLDIEPFNIDEEGLLGIQEGQLNQLPNLLSLKCLKTLRIGQSSLHWTYGQLTPRMILDGLFDCKFLENVTIAKSPIGILNHIEKGLKKRFLEKFPQLL